MEREKAIFLFAHLVTVLNLSLSNMKKRNHSWLPHSLPYSHDSSHCLPLMSQALSSLGAHVPMSSLLAGMSSLLALGTFHISPKMPTAEWDLHLLFYKMDLLQFFPISITFFFFFSNKWFLTPPHSTVTNLLLLRLGLPQGTVLPNYLGQKLQSFWVLLIWPQTHI